MDGTPPSGSKVAACRRFRRPRGMAHARARRLNRGVANLVAARCRSDIASADLGDEAVLLPWQPRHTITRRTAQISRCVSKIDKESKPYLGSVGDNSSSCTNFPAHKLSSVVASRLSTFETFFFTSFSTASAVHLELSELVSASGLSENELTLWLSVIYWQGPFLIINPTVR